MTSVWLEIHQKRYNYRENAHMLLATLEKHSYFLKFMKCQFGQPITEFLGYRVENGVPRINPAKISELRVWPRTLPSAKEVQQILGVLGYQRPLIREFARLARPLIAPGPN